MQQNEAVQNARIFTAHPNEANLGYKAYRGFDKKKTHLKPFNTSQKLAISKRAS